MESPPVNPGPVHMTSQQPPLHPHLWAEIAGGGLASISSTWLDMMLEGRPMWRTEGLPTATLPAPMLFTEVRAALGARGTEGAAICTGANISEVAQVVCAKQEVNERGAAQVVRELAAN